MDEDLSNLRMLQRYFQLLQHHLMGGDEEEEEEEEGTDGLVSVSEVVNANSLLSHPLAHELSYRTGCIPTQEDESLYSMIQLRERQGQFRTRQRVHLAQRLLPGSAPTTTQVLESSDSSSSSASGQSKKKRKPLRSSYPTATQGSSRLVDQYENQVFCGRYSKDGSRFISACQDRHIRIYDADLWTVKKDIVARDVGWSIIDTDFSPDQRYLIYSSWSDYIHLCGVGEEEETHESLDLRPESHRFCLFSIQFSHTSNEILAGSSDRCLYIYDLDRQERTLKLRAHKDDINSVAWADETSQLLFSGSDDALVKVWDRRQLGKEGRPVGVLLGHLEGITHVCSKEDGRYLISNSKDQSIKLWDIRMMCDPSAADQEPRISSGWDYRRGAFEGSFLGRKQAQVFSGELIHPKDTSLKTYRGHRVFQTLIRAYFSPLVTTGQKYIYSGSFDGTVHIYDILTGETVAELDGHAATVRDVAWHPDQPTIVSTSWDGCVREWQGVARGLGKPYRGGRARAWQGEFPVSSDEDEEEMKED